jgi:dienelactone hydrolase
VKGNPAFSILSTVLVLLLASAVHSAVNTETVEYKEGDALLEGYLADDDSISGKRPRVLALHGADDPYVKHDEVASFQKEMKMGGVDWQMVYYGGAVHSFTKKESGDDPSRGVAYNERADRRSWEAMKTFFREIFRGP